MPRRRRGQRKSKHTIPEGYTAPLPAVDTDGERIRRKHRLSVRQTTPPVRGAQHMRVQADIRLRRALTSPKARKLSRLLTEAEQTGEIEHVLRANINLLSYLNPLLPDGWEACFGDSLTGNDQP